MRTHDELADDAARLTRCAELEALLDMLCRRHRARSAEELPQSLPGEEGDRLRQLLDEVKEWTRERRAAE